MDIIVPISTLPSVISLDGTELIPAVKGGVTQKLTPALIKSYISGSNITSQVWLTNVPNPVDGLYHRISVTMGIDGALQYTDLGAI